MDQQKALTVTPGNWTDAADEYIGRALVDASPAEVRAQVEAGARLFYVYAADELIGCYVLRVDRTATGCEGVVVAGGGDHCGVDLVAVLLPVMESQFSGVDSLRVHTSRPGMVRHLLRAGYRATELVFRKAKR